MPNQCISFKLDKQAVLDLHPYPVMTRLNIIYDLDHKLFTESLINYVSLKCNISDYVRQQIFIIADGGSYYQQFYAKQLSFRNEYRHAQATVIECLSCRLTCHKQKQPKIVCSSCCKAQILCRNHWLLSETESIFDACLTFPLSLMVHSDGENRCTLWLHMHFCVTQVMFQAFFKINDNR